MARLLFLVLLLGALARADDKPVKAPTPGHGVIMLKEAWEAGDHDAVLVQDAVAARYAEPGASFVRSETAALRRIERASQELARAVRDKLGAGVELELAPQEKRAVSPLANASLTMLASRIKGDRATTRFRVATRDGERFFRFSHVLVEGDWKIVLSSIDGVPLDEKALKRLAATTDAHERCAEALVQVARDVDSGSVSGKDAIRKRIVKVLDDERRATAEQRSEKRDDGHQND